MTIIQAPLTDGNNDDETLDEMYERLRFESLTEEQQRLVLLHRIDQFEAVPSYVETQARRFATE